MYHNLYITATESHSGKSAIVLGMMQLLIRNMRKVAFFRPIINEPVLDDKDHDTDLMLRHFKLDLPYRDTFAYTLEEARQLFNSGQRHLVIENILHKYRSLAQKYDFVLCEGTDFIGKDAAFEFELNADIAANLGCSVMIIANGAGKAADDILESTQLIQDQLGEKNLDKIGRAHV